MKSHKFKGKWIKQDISLYRGKTIYSKIEKKYIILEINEKSLTLTE